jgi:hypothetical protein
MGVRIDIHNVNVPVDESESMVRPSELNAAATEFSLPQKYGTVPLHVPNMLAGQRAEEGARPFRLNSRW